MRGMLTYAGQVRGGLWFRHIMTVKGYCSPVWKINNTTCSVVQLGTASFFSNKEINTFIQQKRNTFIRDIKQHKCF